MVDVINWIDIAEYCALAIEVAAAVVIMGGLLFAIGRAIVVAWRKRRLDASYEQLRQSTGRALLLGLELLVAADIMHTIVAPDNLDTILALGLTIVFRTFLSIALQVEIEGHWPWHASKQETDTV